MKNQFNPFSLENKTIVITGASSGIGAQCAISCSRMGANVVLMGRDKGRLHKILESTSNRNRHMAVSVDLTDYDQVAKTVKEIVFMKGPIDGLLNCAGISTTLPLKLMSVDKMENFFRSNVISALNITKEVCKLGHFCKDGGSIVFFSSVMGVVGDSGKTLYGMTKGALISAAHSLACELAKKGIRVNCVSPGAIQTPINENSPHMLDPDKRKLLEDKHLLGLGCTEDVAYACIYLLSDASRWVTGSNLVIDGGYSIR